MGVKLSPAEKDALRAYRDAVQRIAGTAVARMSLFGSRARGNGDEHSDLDVLVVLRQTDAALRRALLDAAADIDEASGLRLSAVVLSVEAYERSWPLRDAVERDGVPL
jgi:predicted nucleotidyltransferase